ncbi:hypothetical protein AAC387_Pa02g0709 [Persea americana]
MCSNHLFHTKVLLFWINHLFDIKILPSLLQDTFIIVLSVALTYFTSIGVSAQVSTVFNVMDFGAKGDGKSDDSTAVLNAWRAACSSNAASPILVIPSQRTFLLYPTMAFNGPCKSPKIGIAILGTLLAPPPSAWNGYSTDNWLTFRYVDGLTINGNGVINGGGPTWWNKLCKTNNVEGCIQRAPMSLSMLSCNNIRLEDLHFVDSAFFHTHFWNCKTATFRRLTFRAPYESPDTVGIHLSACQNMRLHNLTIGTGDDCVAIDDKTSNVYISKTVCGPGHGISIGSLGKNGESAAVEDIYVRSVIFIGTSNGARIKTWQGGKGYVKNITYSRMSFVEVKNPITIDQYYCGGGSGCNTQADAVKISDVRFIGGSGTSTGHSAPISLMCSETVPCTDLVVRGVKITPATHSGESKAECVNAHGLSIGEVVPQVPCLK